MVQKNIKLVLVDDNEIVRSSLKLFLDTQEDILVVAEGWDGLDAISLSSKHAPDVILLDIDMPGVDGILATRIITDFFPRIKIIALYTSKDNGNVQKILDSGAHSTISKNISCDEIIKSIRNSVM